MFDVFALCWKVFLFSKRSLQLCKDLGLEPRRKMLPGSQVSFWPDLIHLFLLSLITSTGKLRTSGFRQNPIKVPISEWGIALTGYVVPGCVEDGTWMLWENSSAVVALARFFSDNFTCLHFIGAWFWTLSKRCLQTCKDFGLEQRRKMLPGSQVSFWPE